MSAKKANPTITTRKDGSQAVSWGPARGSRPPFRQGNLANIRHGAFSPRIVAEAAIAVGEELLHLVEEGVR